MEDLQRPRQSGYSQPKTRPWLARLIATLGIGVMTVGLYTPAIVTDVRVAGHLPIDNSVTWALSNLIGLAVAPLPVGRLSLALWLGIDAAMSALMLAGLALL
ncbi:MAG: hypothetical protein ACRDID_20255, partial [Ktedonobacterales bacterium]